jgi:hypothetical protein
LSGVEGCCGPREGVAQIVDDEDWPGDGRGWLSFSDDRDSAALQCLVDVGKPIRAAARDCEKDEARFDLATVRCQARDFNGAESRRAGRVGQKRPEPGQWRPSFEC